MDAKQQLVLVLNMTKSTKVKNEVQTRIDAGQCLGQDSAGCECDRKPHRRGLCSRCYYRFRSLKLSMRDSEAAVFESDLIRLGRLLSDSESRRGKNKSVFARLARGAG